MGSLGEERWSEEACEATIDLWELSETERSDFMLLRDKLKDVAHAKNQPGEVVRFLRARPRKLDAAEEMFRSMIAWRLKHKVDTILQDYHPPQTLLDFYPGAILQGLDKQGDPVYVGRIGVTDGAGILKRFGRDEMIRHAIWVREMVSTGEWIQEYKNRSNGRQGVRRITLIEDLEGMSLSHMNRALLSTYGEIMRLDQDNYPETAKKLVIIRAPRIFRVVWAVAKHFFDAGVVQKMDFCGSDYSKALESYVDLSILPEEVVPEGKGQATAGMPSNFQGGPIPNDT